MKPQTKVDLYQLHKPEYAASKKPILIDVERASYLTIGGQGAPGDIGFTERTGALYGVAYTLKMTRKFAGEQDYVIGKLEAQWWCEHDGQELVQVPIDRWCWKLLIRTPDFVTQAELDKAVSVLLEKGKSPTTRDARLESLVEGFCVQMLHVGPYDRVHETIAIMRGFAEKEGKSLCGRQHDIYLSDPRRVPPKRLKTILRHPVSKRLR